MDSMDKYMDDIEKSLKVLHKGDIVEGEIILFNGDEIVLNLGSVMDGILPIEEIDDSSDLKEGDKIRVMVLKNDGSELLVSKNRADYESVYDDLEESMKTGSTFNVKVQSTTNGGLLTEFKGVRGFIPASQVHISYVDNLEDYIGEVLTVKVMEYNEEKNSVVFSARKVLEEKLEQEGNRLLNNIEEGQIYTGTVKRLQDFGAFVDIGGLDGLVHISEMSWRRVKHPSEVLAVGDTVEVSVLKVDKEKRKISLRLNTITENPWDHMMYEEGDFVKGEVTKLMSFGAFVELENGVEGLIHISEISELRINHPREVLELGETVEPMILEVDKENQKIALTLKEEKEIEFDYEEENEEVTLGNIFKDKFKNLKFDD